MDIRNSLDGLKSLLGVNPTAPSAPQSKSAAATAAASSARRKKMPPAKTERNTALEAPSTRLSAQRDASPLAAPRAAP